MYFPWPLDVFQCLMKPSQNMTTVLSSNHSYPLPPFEAMHHPSSTELGRSHHGVSWSVNVFEQNSKGELLSGVVGGGGRWEAKKSTSNLFTFREKPHYRWVPSLSANRTPDFVSLFWGSSRSRFTLVNTKPGIQTTPVDQILPMFYCLPPVPAFAVATSHAWMQPDTPCSAALGASWHLLEPSQQF